MCCDSMQMSVCKDAKVQNKDAQCLRIASRAIAKSISDQIKAFTESHFPEIKTVFGTGAPIIGTQQAREKIEKLRDAGKSASI